MRICSIWPLFIAFQYQSARNNFNVLRGQLLAHNKATKLTTNDEQNKRNCTGGRHENLGRCIYTEHLVLISIRKSNSHIRVLFRTSNTARLANTHIAQNVIRRCSL